MLPALDPPASPFGSASLWKSHRPRQVLVAFLLALSVHGGLWWWSERFGVPNFSVSDVPPPAAVDTLFDLDMTPPPPNEPGGGAPSPGPKAEVAKALVAPPKSTKVAPRVVERLASREALVHPADESPTPEEEPPTAQDELDPLLAEAFAEPSQFVKPLAARTRTLSATQVPSPAQPQQAVSEQGASAYVGTGSGVEGGPGGKGAGNGRGRRIVEERFVFGGPEGAFQGDVCSIPKGTAAIAHIDECPHLLTFFTDRINVAPRNFREGFPGISDRLEWFAIKYTGAFKTKAPGFYSFRLVSDDGARLLINDHLIIDNDGQHAPAAVRGQVYLSQGLHQLKLYYFQGPGALLALQLFVTPPKRNERPFRPEF